MNNFYNQSENEDDWGWFIPLDIVSEINKKTILTPENSPTIFDCKYDTNKKPGFVTKIKCKLYENLLVYGLFYSCMYVDYLYKCINPYSCYKQKITN
jgi:hypothetical protein